MGTPTFCRNCGQKLPEWIDIAEALEETLRDAGNIPPGLRPQLLQAIREIRDLKQQVETMKEWEPPQIRARSV